MSGNRNMTETRDLHTHHEAMSVSHVLIIWNVCEESDEGESMERREECKKNLVEINVGIGTRVEIRSAVAGLPPPSSAMVRRLRHARISSLGIKIIHPADADWQHSASVRNRRAALAASSSHLRRTTAREQYMSNYGAYLLQENRNFLLLDGGLLRVHHRLD